MMAYTSDRARLTFHLLIMVIAISFGTWFPYGVAIGMINSEQGEILQWIRNVKCSRLIGDASLSQSKTNITRSSAASNTTDQSPEGLWCSPFDGKTEKLLEHNLELSTLWALAASILPIGAFLTVWFTGYLLTHFGSKKVLLVNNLVGVAGSLMCGLCVTAGSYELFILGRVVLGMNVGLVMAIVPLYIAEISPSNLRGMLGTVPGLTLVTGTLIAACLGLPQAWGTEHHWHYLSLLMLVPFGVLCATLPFFPESPRHLIAGADDKIHAKKALQWLRNKDDVNEELRVIQIESDRNAETPKLSPVGLFKNKVVRNSLLICLALMWSQQLTGIGAILLYSTNIFEEAGIENEQALLATVALMVLQIFATTASLLLMDRAGRKILILVGYFGTMAMNICILVCMKLSITYGWARYGTVGCVMLFMVLFNLGPAFVPWILVSEMFSKSSNAAAMTVVSSNAHLSGLIVGFVFPLLNVAIGEWVFLIFAASTAIFSVFVYIRVVETKGKSFEEIQVELQRLHQ